MSSQGKHLTVALDCVHGELRLLLVELRRHRPGLLKVSCQSGMERNPSHARARSRIAASPAQFTLDHARQTVIQVVYSSQIETHLTTSTLKSHLQVMSHDNIRRVSMT